MRNLNTFSNLSAKLLYHSSQTVMCKKCNRKTKGDLFIDETTTEKSIDGKDAHPFIWFCSHNRKHQRKPGWTEPIDFTQIAMRDGERFITDAPDINASDEDWQEWAYRKSSLLSEEDLANWVSAMDAVNAMKRDL